VKAVGELNGRGKGSKEAEETVAVFLPANFCWERFHLLKVLQPKWAITFCPGFVCFVKYRREKKGNFNYHYGKIYKKLYK